MTKQALKLYSKGKRLLIVDDDNSVHKILKRVLSPYFRKIEFARHGMSALKKYKINKYDIVLTDINMSPINGIQLAKEIKKRNIDQAIIVFSASDDVEVFKDMLDVGIDGFIPKPFNVNVVFDKILRVLEKISYKSLIDGLKKDRIIKDFISKSSELKKKEEEEEQKNKEMFYQFCLLEDTPENIQDKQSKKIIDERDVKSAKDLFFYLNFIGKDDIFLDKQIDIIITNFQVIENHIKELILFTQNIEVQMGVEKCEDSLSIISRKMSVIYYALEEFVVLSSIADTFFEMHAFFDGYRVLDDVTVEELEGFLSIETLLQDIKRFVETVFIKKSAEDIHIFDKLLKINLEHLENSMKADLEVI
jgi:CheY-like chemotaxis protein